LGKRIFGAIFAMLLVATTMAQQGSVIKEIVVQGNQNVRTDAILLAMRTKVGQPYVQSTLDQDRKALEDLGFFQAVDVRAVPLDAQNYQILVNVSEFPLIKEIRVVGNTVVSTEEILKAITLQQGQVFNLRSETTSVQAIQQLYTSKGYFALVEDSGPLEESPGTISFSIRELTVNTISIQGNTRTRDRVIARLIKTKEGEPFNRDIWREDLVRIHSTGWFEPDSLEPQMLETEELGKVDLLIKLKEARTGQFNVGLQLDPRSSLAGLLRLSDTNFRGTGQGVGIDFLQGTRGGGASIDVDYSNPWIDNKDTALNVSVYSRIIYRFTGSAFGGDSNPIFDDDNRYFERRTGGTVGLSRPIGRHTSAFISGRFENIDTRDVSTSASDAFVQQDGDVGLIAFGAIRNRRDVNTDPSRGDWLRLSIEPGYSNITRVGGAASDESILGSNTFLRTNLEYRTYFSPQPPRPIEELDAPRRVIAVRVRVGSIMGNVPFFEQFFAGGSDTLRGYPEDRFWGRNMLLTSLEYRHPLQRAFSLIGFVDYGGAWGGYGSVREFSQSDRFKLHLGYGVGLSFRIQSLGQIRLDFGINESGGSRTHFLIGTSF